MCLVCEYGSGEVDEYLGSQAIVRQEMRRVERATLKLMEMAKTREIRQHYSRLHKALVKRRRDWNRVELIQNYPHPEVDKPW